VLSGVKKFVFWDYERGVWQYDVMVAIIVVFVLFTPRQWFRDQPRIPSAAQITSLPAHGESVFWVEPELVSSFPESQRLARLGPILASRSGRKIELTRIEPIYDSEQEIKGYMAFARP
jgi:hypothetical protein